MATTNSEILVPAPNNRSLYTGWTTVDTRENADKLATTIIEEKLAVCTQVEGPITSRYRWEGTLECSEEYRITIKFLESHEQRLTTWINAHHPYDNPQWLAIKADVVSAAYLEWAQST